MQRHQWTPEEKNTVRKHKSLSANQIQMSFFPHLSVKAVQRVKDNLRGEDLPLNGVKLTTNEEILLLQNINSSNKVLSKMFQRKPDEIDRHVNRLRRKHGLFATRRTESNCPNKSRSKIDYTKKTKILVTATDTGKEVAEHFFGDLDVSVMSKMNESFLALLILLIKMAPSDLVNNIRAHRNKNSDNQEIVAIWDYLHVPQAKHLARNGSQRTLCRRLRKATEYHNRILRNISPDKSANVSTFQYNFIRHLCNIRVTSFADFKIHGNLTTELKALTEAIEDVKHNRF